MVKRRFILTVKDSRSQWKEFNIDGEGSNDFTTVTPEEWGQEVVSRYNQTLRPGELPRTLVSVREDLVETNPEYEPESDEDLEPDYPEDDDFELHNN